MTGTANVSQIYAGVGTSAILISVYACVLYQRKLQLKRHQMYMDTVVRALETIAKMRRTISQPVCAPQICHAGMQPPQIVYGRFVSRPGRPLQ